MERFELSMQIVFRIKARLKQLGLKQKDLASLAGSNNSEVSKWLSGNHNFTIKTLDHIQTALGFSFFDFNNQEQYSIPCLPCEYSVIKPVNIP